MELFSEFYFGDVLIFTEDDLYFVDTTSYLCEKESYKMYFEIEARNMRLSFACNYILFLSQAWRNERNFPYKTNFTKDDVRNLIKRIEDEKLKFFINEACKSFLDFKSNNYYYTREFCKEIMSYYKENPINEKLVNMELKLRK